jgi:RNAse (barnase) inhibitor barstar
MTTEYVLNGSKVTSLETFYGEMDRALGMPLGYTPNVDWLDDILSGGFAGIPDGGISLRWMHSEQSQQHYGCILSSPSSI